MSEVTPLKQSTDPNYLFAVFQQGDSVGISHGGFGGSSLAELKSTIGLTPPLETSAYVFGGGGWIATSSVSGTGGAGVTDHGALTGLADNDHPQYVLSSTNNNLSSTVSSLQVNTINYIIDGGGSVISSGVKGDIVFDYACNIESVTLLADVSGSIVIDIWNDTYANYPPTVDDSITASAKPTLSSALKNQDTTLTDWIVGIAVGDILRFNVDSASTLTRVTLAIKVRRT